MVAVGWGSFKVLRLVTVTQPIFISSTNVETISKTKQKHQKNPGRAFYSWISFWPTFGGLNPFSTKHNLDLPLANSVV
jgi:hypothetical protein